MGRRLSKADLLQCSPSGPFIATEAVISDEKDALLIVLRAKKEKGEWQFRGFISISDIDEAGGSVVIVPYLDIIDADWEPDFDSIVDFHQSTRSIRLKKNAKAEGGEPTYKDVKLEGIQTRRRQDGERMDRRWEKLSREARNAKGS
ncbi:MAG: hypothetical protein ACKV19_25525 [Verrucomicrobiales bacterium]